MTGVAHKDHTWSNSSFVDTKASYVGAVREEWEQKHAEYVEEAHPVREGRMLWSQRQVTVLADRGWSENQRTADQAAAGLAERDAANWAHGGKHERVRGRLSAARVERGDRANERAAAAAGKRERVGSNVQSTQICHLVFGTD